MGKKSGSSSISFLYFIGMALVTVGFCCPMFSAKLLGSSNGFHFINFERSSFVTLGTILIFVGAVAGVIACFIPSLKKLKFLFWLISIAGGVILVFGFTTNGGFYKFMGKQFIKYATYGFYMILAGWIVSLCGILTNN